MSQGRLKRPLMLLGSLMVLASLMLSLWSLTMTGDLTFENEELGTVQLEMNADYFDVNVTANITFGDESIEMGENFAYAELNYTADAQDWFFDDTNETNESIPADAVTRYIYPVMPVMAGLSGIMMLGLAFMNPKDNWRWLAVLMLIFSIVAVIYFWYAWDMFLNHLNMSFINESGANLNLPDGVVVSGNPSYGYILLVIGTILAIVSTFRTRDEMFGNAIE